MDIIRLTAHLLILAGAINTGVLTSGNKALLFDCDDTVTLSRLADLGISDIEQILFTQHRRVNTSGAYNFTRDISYDDSPVLIAPAAERDLFEKVDEYWADWKNRWHIYHFQPGPQVLTSPLPVGRAVKEGDVIEWEGYRIKVIDTPGATDGAVSYMIEADEKTFCFSGDVLYGPGQVWDLYSLQKKYRYGVDDYHGFLGNSHKLKQTLKKLAGCGAEVLIPSHGKIIENPAAACSLTIRQLDEAWKNYTSISSLRHYFPRMLEDGENDPSRMPPAPTHPEIPFLQRVTGTTSFLLKSESGAGLVMDCGYDKAFYTLRDMVRSGELASLDGVWVTHYHDDHVDGLGRITRGLSTPIMTTDNMSEILEDPKRFFLPCISHGDINVSKKAAHGESWQWREFTLTAYHFPGQTYYHSGLLAEGRGMRIFFGGDSFSPTGIDDYCAANRNLLGDGVGFNLCLDILRELKPDAVINPHQNLGVSFTDEHIDFMKNVLAEREKLFAEMMPWEHPNFGTDVGWVRTYPYEQDVFRGRSAMVRVQFTNHSSSVSRAKAEPVLPKGWANLSFSAMTSNVAIEPKKDGYIPLEITVPENIPPGQYIIPIRITWNDRYLGQIRHAIIQVF